MEAVTATLVAAGIGATTLILVAIIDIVFSVHQSRKLNEIHVLVNSNFTAMKTHLETALTRIDALEKMLKAEEVRADEAERKG